MRVLVVNTLAAAELHFYVWSAVGDYREFFPAPSVAPTAAIKGTTNVWIDCFCDRYQDADTRMKRKNKKENENTKTKNGGKCF